MSERQTKAVEKQATKKQKNPIVAFVESKKDEFGKALPKDLTAERFTRIALNALSKNPKLMQTNLSSLYGAIMNSAELGLEPNTPLGQAYLIPYGNECQFQIGYRGYLTVVSRSGSVDSVNVKAVYENDDFECEFGDEEYIHHKPNFKDRGKPYLYYCIVTMKNGAKVRGVMTKEEIDMRKAESKARSGSSSPWVKWYDEMAKKTVLKNTLKFVPLGKETLRLLSQDDTVKEIPTESSADDINVLDIEGTEYNIEESGALDPAETVEAEPVQEIIVK